MRFSRIAPWVAIALSATSATALTSDELIAKHIEARGGLEKLKAIRSLRLEGTRRGFGGNAEVVYVQITKRPDAIRTEATLQGLTQVRAYDGTEGWAVQPFRGRKDPERLSADVAKEMAYDADLDGPLIDHTAKKNQVEYLGTEDVEGTDAHKLKVTRPSGDIEYIYLDPDYFLEIRRVSKHRVRGTETESETDYGNYELVQGVYVPFSIGSGAKGSAEKSQKTTFKKADVNVAVDDALFRFPVGAAANPR